MKKRWADPDLDLFLGSNMFVRFVWHPLWGAPEFRAHKFLSFTSSWLVFYWRFHLLASYEEIQAVPSLTPIESGAETVTSARACARDFGPPVFLSYFLLQGVPQPCYSVTTVCLSIYLSIYLFNFLWAVQLRYAGLLSFGLAANLDRKIWNQTSSTQQRIEPVSHPAHIRWVG